MAPWAGRIRHGRFDVRRAPVRAADRDAAPRDPRRRLRPAVGGRSADTIAIELDERWPFRGRVEQRFALDEDGLVVTIDARGGRADARRRGLAPVVPTVSATGSRLRRGWTSTPRRCSSATTRACRRGERVPPSAGPWDDAFTGVGRPPAIEWGERAPPRGLVELPVVGRLHACRRTRCASSRRAGRPTRATARPRSSCRASPLVHEMRWRWSAAAVPRRARYLPGTTSGGSR